MFDKIKTVERDVQLASISCSLSSALLIIDIHLYGTGQTLFSLFS